ncbi:MAG: TolB family protein [Anaerolineae bacterium]
MARKLALPIAILFLSVLACERARYPFGTPTPAVTATPCSPTTVIRRESVNGIVAHFYCGVSTHDQEVGLVSIRSALAAMPAYVRPVGQAFFFADLEQGLLVEYNWLGGAVSLEQLRREWVEHELAGQVVAGGIFIYIQPTHAGSSQSDYLIRATVLHEMHHVLQNTLVNSNSPPPMWLMEGGASTFTNLELNGPDHTIMFALEDDNCQYPLTDLAYPKEGVPFGCYYLEGARAVELLVHDFGKDHYYRLLQETGRQGAFTPAFAYLYGYPFEDFSHAFDGYVKSGYRVRPLVSGAKISVTPLPAFNPSPTPAGPVQPTPTLAPDKEWRTGKIAFASNRSGRFQIYLMKPDGTELRQLTASEGDNTSPSWSGDGKQIYFVSTRDGNSEIYVMSADGSAQTNLTRDSHEDRMPAWLTIHKVAFMSDREGFVLLFVMDEDGSHVTSFPDSRIAPGGRLMCITSVGGQMVAFSTQEDGYRVTRFLDLTTGNTRMVPELSGQQDRSCPFAPALGMTYIMLAISDRSGHNEIYRYDLRTGTEVQLTKAGQPSQEITRSTSQTWLALSSRQSGNWDIYVMREASRRLWNITNDPGDDIQPAWQPY